MSLGPVSSQVPRSIEQHPIVDPRLQVNAGEEDSCLSTMLKTAAVIAGAIALVAGFVLGGPIVGVIIVLVCGAGLFGLFNSCCEGAHHHTHRGQSWYSTRLRPMFFMHNGHSHAIPSGPTGHVPVGRGHTNRPPAHHHGHGTYVSSPHVGVGTGQSTPPPGFGHAHGTHLPPPHVRVGTGQSTPPLPIPTRRDGHGNHVQVGRRGH